jgi:hypothetical protein
VAGVALIGSTLLNNTLRDRTWLAPRSVEFEGLTAVLVNELGESFPAKYSTESGRFVVESSEASPFTHARIDGDLVTVADVRGKVWTNFVAETSGAISGATTRLRFVRADRKTPNGRR